MAKAIIDEDGTYYTKDGKRLYTRDEVLRIMRGTAEDTKYGLDIMDILPEDFVE